MNKTNSNIFFTLGIFLGNKCNFVCDHCAINRKFEDINDDDIKSIVDYTNKNESVEHVSFTGGEPLIYYVPQIEKIVSGVNEDVKISVTSNGSFYEKKGDLTSLMTRLRITKIRLSYDNYHAKYIDIKKIEDIFNEAHDNNIEIILNFSIASPKDMIEFYKMPEAVIKKSNFGKVMMCGNALDNNLYYKYKNFEDEDLKHSCRYVKNGGIVYYPRLGFSYCCGLLAHKADVDVDKVIFKEIDEMQKDELYLKITGDKTFQELAKEVKDIDPQASHKCRFCELLFEDINRKK